MLHDDPPYRELCASVLAGIGGRRSIGEFLRIGKAQLASPSPDRNWLAAVIQGLNLFDNASPEAEEMLLTIYERSDLPGWLRGDAANAAGCCGQICDAVQCSFVARGQRHGTESVTQTSR